MKTKELYLNDWTPEPEQNNHDPTSILIVIYIFFFLYSEQRRLRALRRENTSDAIIPLPTHMNGSLSEMKSKFMPHIWIRIDV